jgi:Collagen triple helix repeat (20 copies)
MFSRIRKRATYGNVVLTLALIFAMTGGAYAAGKYVITSTKQVSPKVLKQLQGKAGKTGPAGPAGTAGLAGANGKDGAPGAEGKQGPAGPGGPEGKTGPQGAEGKEGQTGFTETLPEKATEQGSWGISDSTAIAGAEETAAISFTIPVTPPPTAHYIAMETEEKNDPTGCKGTVAKPEALPGNLCVFALYEQDAALSGLPFFNPEGTGPGAPGAGKSGTVLLLQATEEGKAFAYGDWAVTAE